MPQVLLRYTNGMNQDVDKNTHLDGYYFSLNNGRVVSDKSLTQGAITTIKGNNKIIDMPTGNILTGDGGSAYFNINGTATYIGKYKPAIEGIGWTSELPKVIGWGSSPDTLVLLCTLYIRSTNTRYFLIFSANLRTNNPQIKLNYYANAAIFGSMVNTPMPSINNEVIVRDESSNVFNVYWINTVNGNTSYLYRINLNEPDVFFIPGNMLFDVPDVVVSEPSIIDVQIGGDLKVGKIQYAYCLYKRYSQMSNYSPLSPLFHLTDKSDKGNYKEYCGADRFDNTLGTNVNRSANKSLKIYIPYIDQNYTHIRIISLFYDTLNGAPQVNIVYDGEKLADYGMTVWDNGNSLGTLTVEEALQQRRKVKCLTIAEKNNVLFKGNITEDSYLIPELEDFDTRAYRFNSSRVSKLFTELKPTGTVNPEDPNYWNSDVDLTDPAYETVTLSGANWKTTAATVPSDHNCVNRLNDVADLPAESVNYYDIYDYMYQSDGTTEGGEGINVKYSFRYENLPVDDSYLSSQDSCTIRQNDHDGYGDTPKGSIAEGTVLSKVNAWDTDINGSYRNHASPFACMTKLSLQLDELYAVSIVFKLKDGSDYYAKWIGDIRTPRYLDKKIANTYLTDGTPDPTGNAVWVTIAQCVFTVSIPSKLKNIIQGFTIVSCKRDSENRTVRSVGLLNQLDYKGLSTSGGVQACHHNVDGLVVDVLATRYFDQIRHSSFAQDYGGTVSQQYAIAEDPKGSKFWGEYGGDFYIAHESRSLPYYEYISPDAAFNSTYDIKELIDKFIPIQIVRGNNYVRDTNVDIFDGAICQTSDINRVTSGYGHDMNLTTHWYWVKDAIKEVAATQKIKRSFGHHLREVSDLVTPANDRDYRRGFYVTDSINVEPGGLTTFDKGKTYKHFFHENTGGWTDHPGTTENSPHDKSLICASRIIGLDDFSTEVLISDKYYNSPLSTREMNGKTETVRTGVALYVMHRRIFYPFQGYTHVSRQNREYKKNSVYTPVKAAGDYDSILIGDTFINQYQHVRSVGEVNGYYAYNDNSQVKDIVMRTNIITFPCPSSINTDLRHDTDIPRYADTYNIRMTAGLHAGIKKGGDTHTYMPKGEEALFSEYYQKKDLYLYNTVFSLIHGWDIYLPKQENASNTTQFTTRILASDKKTNDEMIDSWCNTSVFKDLDLEPKHGDLVDLIVWKDRLFGIQQTGIVFVSVNERSAVEDASGDTLKIAGSDILSYYTYATRNAGTSWLYKYSICATPDILYFYDNNRNVMAYLNQQDDNASLSDTKGLYSWFNNNISPNNIRYIQSAYDYNYNEIITTLNSLTGTDTNLVYSDKMNAYQFFMDYFNDSFIIPTANKLLSYYEDAIWLHNVGSENYLYETYCPLRFSGIVTPRQYEQRMVGVKDSVMQLDSIELLSDVKNPFETSIADSYINTEAITSIRVFNSYQDTGTIELVDNTTFLLLDKYIKRFIKKWRLNKFWDAINTNAYRKYVTMRDSYLQIEIVFDDGKYLPLDDEDETKKRSLTLGNIIVNYRDLRQTQY